LCPHCGFKVSTGRKLPPRVKKWRANKRIKIKLAAPNPVRIRGALIAVICVPLFLVFWATATVLYSRGDSITLGDAIAGLASSLAVFAILGKALKKQAEIDED
jgi:membrane associated rhomboid family serine protease